jgi:single stranded DNA-binding protein
MSLANISIVGNLIRPPEPRHFASGRSKTTMYVAVKNTRQNKNYERDDVYKVEAWGKLGELAGQYLSKGNQVAVSGRLLFDHWIDREGKNRVTAIVEASQLAFPPRLKVVSDDDQTDDPSTISNPIGGLLDVTDQEGAEESFVEDAACGDSFSAPPRGEAIIAGSGRPQT